MASRAKKTIDILIRKEEISQTMLVVVIPEGNRTIQLVFREATSQTVLGDNIWISTMIMVCALYLQVARG